MKKILIIVLFLLTVVSYAQKDITVGMTGAQVRSAINLNFDSLYLKKSSLINVETYGARGDGIKDNKTAIQNAINAAIVLKTGILIPSGDYKISGQISSTGFGKDTPLIIIGEGSVNIDFGEMLTSGFSFVSDYSSTVSVTSDVIKGDTIITVSDASGIVQDDIIEIVSNEQWAQRDIYKKGELTRVRFVDGNDIHIYSELNDNYSIDGYTVTVRNTNAARAIVHNINIKIATETTGNYLVNALLLGYFRDIDIRDCSFTAYSEGLSIVSTKGGVIDNCTVYEVQRAGQGYGISIQNSQDLTISNCIIDGCRHGISMDGSYPVRNVSVSKCVISSSDPYSQEPAIDMHGNCEYINITDNIIRNSGLLARCPNVTFNNNLVINGTIWAVIGEYNGYRGRYTNIINNRIINKYTPRNVIAITTTRNNDTVNVINISNNYIESLDSINYAIVLGAGVDSVLNVIQLNISNNIINHKGTGVVVSGNIKCPQASISNNQISVWDGIGIHVNALQLDDMTINSNSVISDQYGTIIRGVSNAFVQNNSFRKFGIETSRLQFENTGVLVFSNNIINGFNTYSGLLISNDVDIAYMVGNVYINNTGVLSNSADATYSIAW